MRQAAASTFALALLAISHTVNAATCESLTSLSLPNVTILMAQPVAAGAFTAPGRGGLVARFENVPAFCRVQASLKPTSDSDIRMELWLPASADGSGEAGRTAWERQVPGHRKRRARGRHRRESESAGGRRSRGLRDGGSQHGARGRLELRAGPSRKDQGLRLPVHARDDRDGQGVDQGLLRPRGAPVVHGGRRRRHDRGAQFRAALSRGLRRHRGDRHVVVPHAPHVRADVGVAGHAQGRRQLHPARQISGAPRRGACSLRHARRAEGRHHRRRAALQVRSSRDALQEPWRQCCAGMPHGAAGRGSTNDLRGTEESPYGPRRSTRPSIRAANWAGGNWPAATSPSASRSSSSSTTSCAIRRGTTRRGRSTSTTT